MLSTSQYTWQRLASHVLWWATPCAWDADAALWTEQASQHVGGGRCLAPDALTFGRGWWWFGSSPLLRAEDHLCALTWETHATGIYLYPCLVKGCWDETEPYRLGPIAFGGIQIDFGISLNDLHRQWTALGLPAHLQEMLTWEVRFVIAACAALSAGDLATYPVPVRPDQRPRLMQQYHAESLPPAVHIIKRAAHS